MFAAAHILNDSDDDMNLQERLFGDRTIYRIPETSYPRFEKEMIKLSRRSMRLCGTPIKPVVFGTDMVMREDGTPHYQVIEVYLAAEAPKLEGWTFFARIDHTHETGNIIRRVPNVRGDVPEAYLTASPNCDHCKVRRLRRDTFLVQNDETGEFQQVGATCLKDFFGHDPYKIAKMAEMLGYADEAARASQTVSEGDQKALNDRRWIVMDDYAAVTAAIVRQHGWVSAKFARQANEEYEMGQRDRSVTSTRTRADIAYLGGGDITVTDDDRALAEAAIEWGQTLQGDNDFEHNVRVISGASFIEARSTGIAAAIVGIYFDRKRREYGVTTNVDLGDFKGVIELMKRPGSRLKHPRINLMVEENGHRMPVVLTIAGPRANVPGSVNVTDGGSYGNNVWYGRVSPNGEWKPSRSVSPTTMASIGSLLMAMAEDPAGVASRHGSLTGQCCFCNKALTDDRSVKVGYGGTCAKNYGLPWGSKAA